MAIVILQARMSSTRLPGKVLKPLVGHPMIWHQLSRIQRAKHVTEIIIATSDDTSDDPIAEFAETQGFNCFRGSLTNVLSRYYHAALPYKGQDIVRLTGDCPFTDPVLLDDLIVFHQTGRYDYTSNAIRRTFPKGLDMEVFTWDTLETAFKNAQSDYHREHVTPYIYESDQFKTGSFEHETDHSDLRWTVDTPSDFELTTALYEALYPATPDFSWQDLLAHVKAHPHLKTLNI